MKSRDSSPRLFDSDDDWREQVKIEPMKKTKVCERKTERESNRVGQRKEKEKEKSENTVFN